MVLSSLGTMPGVARYPITPQKLAGILSLAGLSDPVARTAMLVAIAAAEPPELRPQVKVSD